MELNKNIDEILESEMSVKDGITALLALEGEHPNSVRLQVAIGQLYLSFHETERGGIYLEKAESLYEKNKRGVKADTKHSMYTLLALYRYKKELYEQALEYVKKASKVKVENHSPDEVMRARVLAKLEDTEQALKVFRKVWKANKDKLGIEVLQEYMLLELGQENWQQTIDILDYMEYKFGQVHSLGTLETQVYNKADYELEKIFSYVKEIEFRKFSGEFDVPKIMSNLSQMPREGLSDDGLLVVDAIHSFYKENYVDAVNKLDQVKTDTDYAYYRYFNLVVNMLAGKGNREVFSDYLSDEFEKRYGNTGGYHYYLWNGLKKGDGKYTFGAVKETLERCITLSPNTLYARQSRLELGSLLGLSDADARLILIKDELDEIYYALADTNAPISTIIAPVLKAIGLPNNVYSNLAVSFLHKMVDEFPQILQYFKQNKGSLSPATRKHLTQAGISVD